jgi:outer membrane protein OmpA-like peptidoglycan-associated protein
LVDVISFFNGAYPYRKGSEGNVESQLQLISRIRAEHPFNNFTDVDKNGHEDLCYALSSSATIETLRIALYSERRERVPHRIELLISKSPGEGFQSAAVFVVPSKYYEELPKDVWPKEVSYDFFIKADQKISGNYLCVRLSGSKWGSFRLSRLNVHGRFEQPAKMREDFSGIYFIPGMRGKGTPADEAMKSQSKTGFNSYVILSQEGAQVNGCYVHGGTLTLGRLAKVEKVLGTFTGGVEGNLFRFTRIHAEDGSQSQGVISLSPPVEAGMNIPTIYEGAYMLVLSGEEKAKAPVEFHLVRRSSAPMACVDSGQKEKSASETLAENLEKTGRVQLYGVNFDFDADTLRPESGAVLDEVVKLAQANPSWKFEIGGHTDSLGAADYNQKLSERRAASVVRYLTGKGVAADRLQARGYGVTRPLVPEGDGNEAARAQNRRVELVKQ